MYPPEYALFSTTSAHAVTSKWAASATAVQEAVSVRPEGMSTARVQSRTVVRRGRRPGEGAPWPWKGSGAERAGRVRMAAAQFLFGGVRGFFFWKKGKGK